jgi:hypothetical protein
VRGWSPRTPPASSLAFVMTRPAGVTLSCRSQGSASGWCSFRGRSPPAATSLAEESSARTLAAGQREAGGLPGASDEKLASFTFPVF